MNGTLFLQKRSRRHMARLMESYEKLVAPHLPPDHRGESQAFKAEARSILGDITSDAIDVVEATETGIEINGAAVELRDRVGAH